MLAAQQTAPLAVCDASHARCPRRRAPACRHGGSPAAPRGSAEGSSLWAVPRPGWAHTAAATESPCRRARRLRAWKLWGSQASPSTQSPVATEADTADGDDSGVELVPSTEETFEARLLREAIQRASAVDEKPMEAERVKWSKVKERLRPTQAALGYDWCFYKLKNFTSEAAAQRYMDSKPVPYVQRGKNKYVVDHHHTLAALELFTRSTGCDITLTLERVRSFDAPPPGSDGAGAPPSALTDDAFWGLMEGKGWAFLRDEQYNRSLIPNLPKDFTLSSFRNDVYRSMGGFARVYDVLKRGKELEDLLFFEFRWGFFFWLHRNDSFSLWPDKRLLRAFQRCVALVEQIDAQEYAADARANTLNVKDCIYLSQQVIEPAYQLLSFYLRNLAIEYDNLKGKDRIVPGLQELFGHETLPGKVVR